MFGLHLSALRVEEIRASLLCVGSGSLLALVSFSLGWDSGLSLYLGFLSMGLILAGLGIIPLSMYSDWLSTRAPTWFRQFGPMVPFAVGVAAVILVIFIAKHL